ncbi:hypothetical protein [Pseudomonas juntendi]|uniref:hypothetical protein n=1 Tax=Pseudomonas juntendi TaxID=2666183 RepID=UPI001F448890|nr:hypothetical protein [Pseudomonas juntendi]MCO7055067.1 hypothetical protein [Pseudomonas juntendi]UJM10741.1 hypothetical protein L1P09_15485 [Pseudomonas juntendi]UXA40652.1 hypothetical protein KZA81_09930 [Pseudomonas juntendi]
MDRDELEQRIEQELKQSERKVLNRNAFSALFGAFADPVGALGKIFLGRGDAIAAEKQRIQQSYVLDLLCAIDAALTQVQTKARFEGIVINGLIETDVDRAEVVTGAHIASDVKNVQIQPGTHIKTTVGQAKTVTGFKVGG